MNIRNVNSNISNHPRLNEFKQKLSENKPEVIQAFKDGRLEHGDIRKAVKGEIRQNIKSKLDTVAFSQEGLEAFKAKVGTAYDNGNISKNQADAATAKIDQKLEEMGTASV